MNNVPHLGGTSHNETGIDIHKIKNLLVKYWYWFIISLSISLSATYIYLRYQAPTYRSATTILLKDATNQGMSRIEMIDGFGLSPEMKNTESQMFIIRSQKMVKRAINRLDFEVTYMSAGKLKETELYRNAPFIVYWDSTHTQLTGVNFHITSSGNDSYTIKAESEAGYLYNYPKEQHLGTTGAISINNTYNFGENITAENYSFRVERNANVTFKQDVDYYFRFNTINGLVSQYRGSLGVSPYSEGSPIVILSIVGQQPQKMNVFLSVLSEVIMEYNLDKKNQMATRSLNFIGMQLKNVADTLQIIQQQLADFRRQNPFISTSDGSKGLAGDYLNIEKELRMKNIQLDYLTQLTKNLNEKALLEDYFVLIVGKNEDSDPLVTKLVQELISLSDERLILGSKVSERNPYISDLDKKTENVKQNLKISLSQMILKLKKSMDDDRLLLGELRYKINQLPAIEREYAEIDRRYKLNDAIYTFLLQKQSENQIARASNTSDNEVLEEPSVVALVGPAKNRYYSRSFMIGLLIPAVIIFLYEFFDTKIRTLDQLKNLAGTIPVVGAIPNSETDVNDLIHTFPNGKCSEAFRRLRVKMQYLLSGKDKKVILISSTNTGEGKSFSSYNLAQVFAISGKKTVLIGFDLRKPKLHQMCGVSNALGLSSYLSEQSDIEDIIIPLKHNNLSLIPAGEIPPNPAELILQSRTDKLFTYLRENYDVIIIDTAPIGLVADTRTLVNYADSFLFVTRVDVTNKEHLKMTLENLTAEKITSIGLILNGIQTDDRFFGYYGNTYAKREEN